MEKLMRLMTTDELRHAKLRLDALVDAADATHADLIQLRARRVRNEIEARDAGKARPSRVARLSTTYTTEGLVANLTGFKDSGEPVRSRAR